MFGWLVRCWFVKKYYWLVCVKEKYYFLLGTLFTWEGWPAPGRADVRSVRHAWILLGGSYPKHYQIALTKAGTEMLWAELLMLLRCRLCRHAWASAVDQQNCVSGLQPCMSACRVVWSFWLPHCGCEMNPSQMIVWLLGALATFGRFLSLSNKLTATWSKQLLTHGQRVMQIIVTEISTQSLKSTESTCNDSISVY